MIYNIQILHTWTSDGLRLQGVHYIAENKDICVIFIHGMSGNFIENIFADIMGKTFAENGIGFIYGHNRGYSHINDIVTKEFNPKDGYKRKRIGVMYERFAESEYDIQTWIDEAKQLGYKRIILIGHSLGSPKVVYYLSRNKVENLIGIVLMSPGDMVGLIKKPEYQNNPPYEILLQEAKKNATEGNQRKLLSGMIWDWYMLSSQTFLDLFQENGPVDVLPILRNPDTFPELSKINVPILCTMGECDDVVIRSLEDDMALLKSKATNAPSFETKIISQANHNYEKQEQALTDSILEWIKSVSVK